MWKVEKCKHVEAGEFEACEVISTHADYQEAYKVWKERSMKDIDFYEICYKIREILV